MTVRADILTYLRAHPGPRRSGEIGEHCEASINNVYAALSDLVTTGELERVSTGIYRMAGDTTESIPETEAEQNETIRAPRVTKPRVNGTKRVEPKPAPESDLLIGAWSSGALTIARGDAEIVLTIEERRKLQTWIEIMDEEAL